jgi:EmrB/QacA subfamily drug resistance transporter
VTVQPEAAAEPRPSGPLLDDDGGHPRRWLILGVLCLALMVIIIDETVLNIALPALVRELHASSSDLQWAVDAYVLVYAALLFPAGNLGDRYGRRLFLLAGLVIFGIGSALATWSVTPGMLIGARAVMGVGGACIMPGTLSLLVYVFPSRQRPLAIGVWSGVSGIGILLGPILAGWLIERYWWGSVFLVNMPVVVVAFVAGWLLLPESRDRDAAPVDPVGSVLAVVALLGVLYAVIEWPARGIDDVAVAAAGIVGLLAGVAFVVVELRSARPMFDVRVLRVPVVGVSCLVVVAGFLTLLGSSFVLTQYLQLVQGRSPVMTGLLFGPTTIGWSAVAPLSPRAVRRFGARATVAVAMLGVALSYALLATTGTDSGVAILVVAFALMGVAMGLATTPVTELIVTGLPPERAGVGSALNDAARQVAGAVGVAVFGSMLAAGYRSAIRGHASGEAADNLAAALRRGDAALAHTAREAFLHGYIWVMVSCALVCALAALVVARSSHFARPPD